MPMTHPDDAGPDDAAHPAGGRRSGQPQLPHAAAEALPPHVSTPSPSCAEAVRSAQAAGLRPVADRCQPARWHSVRTCWRPCARCRRRTPALAHTASERPRRPRGIARRRFIEVLVKPMRCRTAVTIRRPLGSDLVSADGEIATVRGLPALGRRRSPCRAQRRAVAVAAPVDSCSTSSRASYARRGRPCAETTCGVGRYLHLLRASCGFVGAPRLGRSGTRVGERAGIRFCIGSFSGGRRCRWRHASPLACVFNRATDYGVGAGGLGAIHAGSPSRSQRPQPSAAEQLQQHGSQRTPQACEVLALQALSRRERQQGAARRAVTAIVMAAIAEQSPRSVFRVQR